MSVLQNYNQPPRINFNWIQESFSIFQRDIWIWLLGVFVSLATQVLCDLFETLGGGPTPTHRHWTYHEATLTDFVALFGLLICFACTIYIRAGLYKMAVKAVRGEPLAIEDIFSGLPVTGSLFLFDLIIWVIIGSAFLLSCFCLCWPVALALFLPLIMVLPGYAAVADRRTAGEAISMAFNPVSKDFGNTIVFGLVFGLIFVFSLVPCGLGYFVTYPMSTIISALAYRDFILSDTVRNGSVEQQGDDVDVPGSWPPPPSSIPPLFPEQK